MRYYLSNKITDFIQKYISKDYAFEVAWFYKLFQDFKDGITFFNIDIRLDLFLMDHTPKFEFIIILLNYVIIDLNIYYIHHREEDEI